MAPKLVSLLLLIPIFIMRLASTMGKKVEEEEGGGGSWFVARSDGRNQALQTALDYVCRAGADCIPIQSNGLCYLPNTLQAHASYAFNSFYQRKARAPGSCDFAATSTIALTDPSYGSCVYPSSSVSTAGGTNTPITTSPNVPTPTTNTSTPPIYGGDDAGGLTPGMIPPIPDNSSSETTTISILVFFSTLLILSLVS